MNNETGSKELEQTVGKLDALLIEGFLKFRTKKNNYFQTKEEKDFNVITYKKELTDTLDEWYKSVIKILDSELQEKHHLFHFLQHEGSSMSLIGVPIEVSNLLISFEYYLYALEAVILRLQEKRNLTIRQEIAELEHQADILYKVSYSEHTREVKLNGIILTKTDFDSENDNCFQFIYNNCGRAIHIDEIEKALGDVPKKRLAHVIRDLGFTKELKTIFFPVATKSQVMFVNPITKQYAHKNNLPPINFKKVGRQSEAE